MAEEIGFENGRNSNFQGLVTLTLKLDPAIRHTVYLIFVYFMHFILNFNIIAILGNVDL